MVGAFYPGQSGSPKICVEVSSDWDDKRANPRDKRVIEKRRIERRTASMLKKNYTTKPHPHLM